MDESDECTELVTGQNVPLADEHSRLTVAVVWSDPDGTRTVELSALLLDDGRTVRGDADMVFYNQPESSDGSVRYLGVRSSEEGLEEARVSMDLAEVPAEIESIVLIATVDPDDFSVLDRLRVSVDGSNVQPVAQYSPKLQTETAAHLGDVYRRAGGWRFRAVGQGLSSGLAGVARDFGINVDDDTDAPDGTDDSVIASAADGDEKPSDAANDHAVRETDLPRASDVGETGDRPPAPKRRPVRTKRKVSVKPPSVQLADDPSWQVARLFPVAGMGGGAEQEARATSALLP